MAPAPGWRHAPRVAPLRKESAGRSSRPELEPLEDRLDQLDVPAAVVCARCGDAECAGCQGREGKSGIVSVVAWERAGVPTFTRLWATARATTRDADAFFEGLPDGPLLPALRFAATCELLATTAMFLVGLAIALVSAPGWVKHLAVDEAARNLTLRVLLLGVPAFAALLVCAHAAHGLSIDVGAKKQGAKRATTRALRFGLYACGWDLVIGPLGAVVLAAKEGASAALSLTSLGAGLPTRATNAFLRGAYHLDGEEARRALGTSYVGAVAATLVGAFLVLGAIVVVLVS